MTPEQFIALDRLFKSASPLRGDERRAFLDRETDGDDELRQAVERLLAADAELPTYLDDRSLASRARARAVAALDDDETDDVPDQIGPYAVRGLLGAGGMGVVYRVREDGGDTDVALKILRTVGSSRALLKRFEHEGRALGRLDHPGIARIIGTGEAEVRGERRPFIVMELIDGLPLVQYARQNTLDRQACVSLLATVADAVQHAHVKGVIHRDLKPANILVTSDGCPYVLDFGVARVTNLEQTVTSMQTDVGQLVGTVPYMSPEQIGADPEDLDARSDVYALGILLYELLTGDHPFDLKGSTSVFESTRAIREDEPRRLSAADASLRGDLDVIAATSIQRDRDRRYQSAGALAADLRRYLAGEPIAARRDSLLLVTQKKIARHRVATVVVTSLTLIAAIISIAWNVYLVQQRQASLTTLEKTMALLDRVIEPFADDQVDPAILADIEAWADEALDDLPVERARALNRIGLAHLKNGTYDEAEPHLLGALALRREHLAADDERVAESWHNVGRVTYFLGRYDDSEEAYRTALRIRRALHPGDHLDVAWSMNGLAAALRRQRHLDEAEALYSGALAMRLALLDEGSEWVASSRNGLAVCLRDQGRIDEALALFEIAVRQARHAGVKDLYIARGLRNMAACHIDLGSFDEAQTLLDEATHITERETPPGHADRAANARLQESLDSARREAVLSGEGSARENGQTGEGS